MTHKVPEIIHKQTSVQSIPPWDGTTMSPMDKQVAKKPAIKITKATEARIAKKKEIAIKEASEEANKAFDQKRKTLSGLDKKVASKAKK